MSAVVQQRPVRRSPVARTGKFQAMGKFRWIIDPTIFPIAGKLPVNRGRAYWRRAGVLAG
jgi:hypothetical protein